MCKLMAGWWFSCNMTFIWFFQKDLGMNHPNWLSLTLIFFRGVGRYQPPIRWGFQSHSSSSSSFHGESLGMFCWSRISPFYGLFAGSVYRTMWCLSMTFPSSATILRCWRWSKWQRRYHSFDDSLAVSKASNCGRWSWQGTFFWYQLPLWRL